MKVLIACEFSGIVRDAFTAFGCDAWSCDLLPSERTGQHIQDDVLKHLDGWDLIIAHPPCTYLANSGVRWLRRKDRWSKMMEACEFFNSLLLAPCQKVCVENPVQHGYAAKNILRPYSQTIQPWQFGHGEVKRTCLWLQGLPLLKPVHVVEGRKPRVHFESPGPERWKNRSRSYQGIAAAMAAQWCMCNTSNMVLAGPSVPCGANLSGAWVMVGNVKRKISQA